MIATHAEMDHNGVEILGNCRVWNITNDLKTIVRTTQSNQQTPARHDPDQLKTESLTESQHGVGCKATTAKIPKNVFSRLHLFFNTKVDCFILPAILDDLIIRKKYSLDNILNHLEEFQTAHHTGIPTDDTVVKDKLLSGKLFTYLLGEVFDGSLSQIVHPHHIHHLASLVINHKDCFEELLSGLCRNEEGQVGNRIRVLESALQMINEGRSSILQTIDQRLSCGETALKLAVRFRSEHILLLLLRHGASIHNRWLCFNSAFEVLLFSPHHVYTSPEERKKILNCLELLLRASDHVKIAREDNARHNDLIPFIPDWYQLIPDDRVSHPCSLKHKCRLQVRNLLHKHKKLPAGIASLPLPSLLKSYLDLGWS